MANTTGHSNKETKLSVDREVFVDSGESEGRGVLVAEAGHCGLLNTGTVRPWKQFIQEVTCEGGVR